MGAEAGYGVVDVVDRGLDPVQPNGIGHPGEWIRRDTSAGEW